MVILLSCQALVYMPSSGANMEKYFSARYFLFPYLYICQRGKILCSYLYICRAVASVEKVEHCSRRNQTIPPLLQVQPVMCSEHCEHFDNFEHCSLDIANNKNIGKQTNKQLSYSHQAGFILYPNSSAAAIFSYSIMRITWQSRWDSLLLIVIIGICIQDHPHHLTIMMRFIVVNCHHRSLIVVNCSSL